MGGWVGRFVGGGVHLNSQAEARSDHLHRTTMAVMVGVGVTLREGGMVLLKAQHECDYISWYQPFLQVRALFFLPFQPEFIYQITFLIAHHFRCRCNLVHSATRPSTRLTSLVRQVWLYPPVRTLVVYSSS